MSKAELELGLSGPWSCGSSTREPSTHEPSTRGPSTRGPRIWVCAFVFAWAVGTWPCLAGAGECEVTLDLSRGDLGFDASVTGAVTCVQLTNAIPSATYEVELGRETCIAPLSTDAFSFGGKELGAVANERADGGDPCATATSVLTTALSGAKSESAVKQAVEAYEAKKLVGCSQGDAAVATTRKKDGSSLVVGGDETLVVTVVRKKTTALDSRKWQIPSSCSGWQTTYGFTFVPNRDRKFISKVNEDEEGTFIITQEEDREEGDFLASILFRYSRPGKNYGPVFGLGYDLKNISVLGGFGYTFKQNVTITAGVAIHERTDLVGRYNVGDVIKENIGADQLLEKTFVPNAYVGLSFRFGSNIFSQRDTAQAKALKASADAAKKAKDEAKQEADKAEANKKKVELAEAKEKECKLQAEHDLLVAKQACATTRATEDEECREVEDSVEKTSCLETAKSKAESCAEIAEANKQVAVAACEVVSKSV